MKKLQLLVLLLLNYFILNLITNITGALLPFWKEDFHLSNTLLSLLGSSFFLAYGLTSLPQGVLHDNIGSKKTFLWGTVLVFIGSLIFAVMPKYQIGLVSLFITGIGITALQIVNNLLIKKVNDNPALYTRNMTFAQIFAGMGSAGGGLLVGFLIKNIGLQWQSAYTVFVALAAFLGLFALLTTIPETRNEVDYVKPTKSDYVKLIKNPLMFMFALGIFIYVGIEVGAATWIPTYLVENHGVDKILAAQIVSMYWIFQSVGRIVGGFTMNYVSAPKALVGYSLACLASLIFAVFAPTANMSSILFIAVGFFTSIMFSSIFSFAVNSFDKSQEGVVAGILCTAIVGGAVTAPFIGFVASLTNSLGIGLIVGGAISFLYIAFIGLKSIKAPIPVPVSASKVGEKVIEGKDPVEV